MMTLSLDTSAIEAREKRPISAQRAAEKKEAKDLLTKSKEELAQEAEFAKQEAELTHKVVWQVDKSEADIMKQLHMESASGAKRNSKGMAQYWHGYKFIAITNNDGIPIDFELVSAKNNDMLLAVPMLKRLEENNIDNWCYMLMDKGFSSDHTREYVKKMGKTALIDYNNTSCKDPEKIRKFDEFEQEVYKNRTDVERFFGDIKDNYGLQKIYVKGNNKVKLMFTFAMLAMLVKKNFKEKERNEKQKFAQSA
jgi:hypothetical protein